MAPITRARRAREAASSDRLPTDVLSDILQRFPAKDLCRLRTVCRSWRSIITDKAFITEHADSHKEPLFLAQFRDDKKHVYVVDLSGNVVKQIAGADDGLQVLRTRLDLACQASEWNKCCVLSPATGGIRQVLSLVLLPNRRNLSTFFAFGKVASTKEYKLLRSLITFNEVFGREQLSGVHVLTIDGGTSTNHAQWRRKPAPPLAIDVRSGIAVHGVVYFLTSQDYFVSAELSRYNMALYQDGVPADYIVSFDLEREEWRRILYGPSGLMACNGNLTSGPMVRRELTLADLNGSLVVADHPRGIMDLWFLLDFESGLWVKQYSIHTESVTTGLVTYHLIPLLVLDDGRLVIHLAPHGLLLICDPGTNTFTRMNTRDHVDSVAVYTGNLLSLQEGDMV